MDEREHAGADHGKDGHGLGKAVDGVAPLLLEEQQDGRDQRSGVADTDPPNEIDDGEAPAHGDVEAPDADTLEEQPGHCREQDEANAPRQGKAEEPTQGRMGGEHDARNNIGDRFEGVSGRDNPELACLRIQLGIGYG